MAINLLSDNKIKNAKPKDKTYTINDGGGMSLEVSPQGGRWWRFRYKFDGKAKKVSLGTYPDTPLKDAREKRDDARKDVAKKIDPFPSKGKAKTSKSKYETFEEWTEYYLDKVADEVSQTHLDRSEKGWKKDVFPVIGIMPINEIEPKHIIQILHVMNERGVKESAKKMFSSISRVFQVCMANYPEEIHRNPTKDIALKDILGKRKKAHYPIITDAKELGLLLEAIDGYKGHLSTKLALKMIANVFVRPHNIRHARWEQIDLEDKRQWVIPASETKTKKELIVPLSIQAINILTEAKKESPNTTLVFPSPRGKDSKLSDAALVGALRRLGYTKDEIVAHSFRGIFSTIAHEKNKYTHEVIETQLAHSVGTEVSQAYNRAVYLEERTEMMQWYSDLLEGYQNGH